MKSVPNKFNAEKKLVVDTGCNCHIQGIDSR
jgi:hypothetical protein